MKEQINRSMERNSPEIDPHKHGQLTFVKKAKIIQWQKKKKYFSTNYAKQLQKKEKRIIELRPIIKKINQD